MKIHHLSTEEAFSSMQSAPSGLTSQEPRRHLAEYRPNDVEKVPRQLCCPCFLAKKRKAFGKIRQGKAGRGISFKWIENANSNIHRHGQKKRRADRDGKNKPAHVGKSYECVNEMESLQGG
jgi:hypothetical protein